MIVANILTAALLTGAPAHGAQPAPPPATNPAPNGATAAPGAPAPAHGEMGHGDMMSKEMDKSIPGDSPIFKTVQLKIASPKEGQVISGSDMDITFKLTGYALAGSQPGPHIHVIIDNQPYQPDYDASKPFHVTGLSMGPHTLRAFPSRPWHESIKAPKAFAIVHFFVGEKVKGKGLANWIDAKKPILTYSRPKGDYSGDEAKDVMVDFYVTNAKLSPTGDKVKMTLDGKETVLSEWKPVHLTGPTQLADGKHTISLDLLDKSGKPIANVFNHTEREFTVNGAAPAAPAPSTPPAQPQQKAETKPDASKLLPFQKAEAAQKEKEKEKQQGTSTGTTGH